MSSTSYSTTLPLSGKVALVTGSSRSIGASIVRSLAAQGANVVVNYANNAKPAEDLASEINSNGAGKAVAIKGDAGSISGGKALLDCTIKEFGKLDILVLSAGIMGDRPLAQIDEKYYDDHMNINAKVPLFLVKAATKYLPSPGGRIIFISSSLSAASGVTPNYLCYLMSKGAVEQASRVLSKDLSVKGITVNTVSPGPVDTALFREGKPQAVIDAIAGLNPLKRLGQPEEIAPLVTFLSSPDAQWINGQNIRVNGAFVV